jgi:hypothetical protein
MINKTEHLLSRYQYQCYVIPEDGLTGRNNEFLLMSVQIGENTPREPPFLLFYFE